jgi:hypothetical protein
VELGRCGCWPRRRRGAWMSKEGSFLPLPTSSYAPLRPIKPYSALLRLRSAKRMANEKVLLAPAGLNCA